MVDTAPIFIARRGGNGAPLNGVIYRVLGYAVDFTDRYGQMEGWLNERTKVALG